MSKPWLVYTWLKTWRLYTYRILFALGGKSKQTSCSWTQTLRDGETRIGKVYLMTPYSLTDYRLINLSGFLVDFFEIIVPPPLPLVVQSIPVSWLRK